MNLKQFNRLGDFEKENTLKLLDDRYVLHRNIKFGISFFIVIVCLMMYGCPKYNVWEQGLAGQAELKRAQQNRQIKVEEAKAAEESAESYKNAEIIRAEGVKVANDIVQTGLGGPEGYLRYLFINGMNESNCQRVYIPTEAAMPLLEARK